MGVIELEKIMDLKGGENSHQKAELYIGMVDGKPARRNIYSPNYDLGKKVRNKGWTNIGDISACVKATVGLEEIYKDSETPYIVVAAKHTRPVVLAVGKTQLDATIKAIAADLNSPFGGFWGFNMPFEYNTAEFLDRVFMEGVVAPEYDSSAIKLLSDNSKIKNHENRFLIQSGKLSKEDVNAFDKSIYEVGLGYYLGQDLDRPFNARKEAVVVTGNDGNSDINSLDDDTLKDVEFAGNAAIYLSSNLIFFVHNQAVAGLGDGCGARTFAAEKARRLLEISSYAALSRDKPELWERVLYDTPFEQKDFENLKMPLNLTVFSDAFFPKMDGFVEATGIDRLDYKIGMNKLLVEGKPFIPKRNNFDDFYDETLIPATVVQPGGSMGDKYVLPLAEKYDMRMIFTMTPEKFKKYQEKGPGKGVTGRRFFGHIIM